MPASQHAARYHIFAVFPCKVRFTGRHSSPWRGDLKGAEVVSPGICDYSERAGAPHRDARRIAPSRRCANALTLPSPASGRGFSMKGALSRKRERVLDDAALSRKREVLEKGSHGDAWRGYSAAMRGTQPVLRGNSGPMMS